MAYSGGLAGTAVQPIGSGVIDAYGNIVPPWQYEYVGRINYNSAIAGMPQPSGVPVYYVNPNYNPNWGSGGTAGGGASTTPAAIPPQFQVTFDTIGQTIFRSIGHCRLPFRIIWAQGINVSGTTTTSPTITFAAALCAPIDQDETGQVAVIFAGETAIYDPTQGGVIAPDGLSVEDAAALALSLQNAVVYPGDEAQLPAPLIVADKGADVTNAFRGIRYIIFPLFPTILLTGGGGGGLSMQWERTNTISYTPAAVEFAAGTA